MDDQTQPSAPEGGEGPAANDESEGAAAPLTAPLAGFELDALLGQMIVGEDDEDVIAVGRGALDTIPLPPDEIERLQVLTRGKLAQAEAASRARRDRLPTLLSPQAEGHGSPRVTPVPSTPRTMRGVEILLGAPIEPIDEVRPTKPEQRAPEPKRAARWRAPAIAAAAAVLLPIGAYGLQSDLFRASASEVAPLAVTIATPSTSSCPSEAPASLRAAGVVNAVNAVNIAGERAPTLETLGAQVEGPLPEASQEGDIAADARAALMRLRAGVIACARENIGVLPGTSPPVPTNLHMAKGLGYSSAPRDWGTPVWSCAAFAITTPQRFQIQWQALATNVEGIGVAWLDDDQDGSPDRALGFRATLKDRGQPEAGDIEALDPTHPIARPSR